MNLDRVKDKIRKLLGLAADDSTVDGEITAAMSLADKAMREYHLTAADLEIQSETTIDNGRERVHVQKTTVGRWKKSLAPWEDTLANAIATLVGSIGVYRSRERGGTFGQSYVPCLQWYGVAEDVQLARDLYDEWSHVIVTIAVARYGGAYRGDGASYCWGFSTALRNRANKIAADRSAVVTPSTTAMAKAETGSLADMLVRYRDDAKSWLAKEHGVNLRNVSLRHKVRNVDALADGQSDGLKANFTVNRRHKLTS